MITAEDIHYLYKKYLSNQKDENLLEDYFGKSVNKEEWVRRMRERATKLRDLYNDNENLLNTYFYPFVKGEEPLTDEIVTAFAKELQPVFLSNSDYVLITKAAELIEPYAEAHNMMEEHIIALCTLGSMYQSMGIQEDILIAYNYYLKLDKYRNRVSEFSSDKILRTFYQGIIWQGAALGNMEASKLSDVTSIMLKNMDYLCNTEDFVRLIDKTDPENGKFLIRRYSLYALIAKLIRTFDYVGIEDELAKALEAYKSVYHENLLRAEKQYEVPIEYAFTYYKLRWLNKDYPFNVFFGNALKFYDTVYNTPEAAARDNKNNFNDTNNAKLYLYYIPNLLEAYTRVGKIDTNNRVNQEVLTHLVESLIAFIPKIPKGYNDSHMCSLIFDSINQALPIMSETDYDVFDIVYSYVIKRDMDLSIHSHMVAKISSIILESVYRNKPELLVGCLGTESVDEVKERFNEISEYLYKGALIHDLGKISVSFVTKKQTRRLTDEEFGIIKLHPRYGCETAELHEILAKYKPIILGHHKTYSEKGYPDDYTVSDNDNGILVSIIQLSDCLDAATDSLGRTYLRNKTSDDVIKEFSEGKNDRYHPDVVSVVEADEVLKKALYELTNEGRIEVCCEVYDKYME